MTNLVIQSFGKENEYKRAILTVLSYYACTSLAVEETRVLLFTDKPEYFKSVFENLPVDYKLLTPGKIKQMRGEIDFLHRMKIALIDEAFALVEGNLLYADSDTFFISDPTALERQLSPDKCFMHLWEFKFAEVKNLPLPAGKTSRDFVNLVESKEFILTNHNKLKVTLEHVSWNAGVMFFHPTHARFIPDVYALTDQFYPDTLNHASEQFAFSVVLQENIQISSCNSVVYHYWYRIKKLIVDLFLEERITKDWGNQPLEHKLADVRKWTEILPGHFENHILTIKDHAIQSFNEKRYEEGYRFTAKVIRKELIKDRKFLLDVLYHTKSYFLQK